MNLNLDNQWWNDRLRISVQGQTSDWLKMTDLRRKFICRNIYGFLNQFLRLHLVALSNWLSICTHLDGQDFLMPCNFFFFSDRKWNWPFDCSPLDLLLLDSEILNQQPTNPTSRSHDLLSKMLLSSSRFRYPPRVIPEWLNRTPPMQLDHLQLVQTNYN